MNLVPSLRTCGRPTKFSSRSRTAGAFPASLLLAACAGSYEPVDASATVEETVYEQAVDACHEQAEASGHGQATLVGAAIGVVYGAAQGALTGAVWGGNSAEGAAIGAAAGFVIGAVAGAVEDTTGYEASMDSCMAEQGYRPT